ncbi:MAG TPA: oligopeptide transporter, OPT family [Elusimicrobiales bacterium]|nr:oligopeptide transporter, OPT family [Elusimicrobiales bacterium]
MEEQNPAKKFQPYVPPSENMPESTLKSVILGAIFAVIFGASTVYLGLKVGLTVSASIPIAVLAIAVFKKIGKSTILENNMVQTIGSIGESVAAGVIFTVPALVFLAGGTDYFKYFQIYMLALVGGIVGTLFMVPLRRSLTVKDHGKLPFPEGTACADVLIAGEKGGNLAKKVYSGLGIAFGYKILMSVFGLWKEVPTYIFSKQSALPNGTITGEVAPELLGVGYIIGPKIAGYMIGGGILSWLVIIPLITLMGDQLDKVIPPATQLISEMTPRQLWNSYIRYIGAGAVTFGGIVTLVRSLPTIISAFKDSIGELKKGNSKGASLRTQRDIPLPIVVLGGLALIAFMALLPKIPITFFTAMLIVVFGFFFVTVSSRVVGILGSSSNPISGMTIATLMATCLIFVGLGKTGDVFQSLALTVGAFVCIAASSAGCGMQNLKTGYLVGATPVRQQWGLIIGVIASSAVVGAVMLLLNNNVGIGPSTAAHPNPLPAPQAMLMATVVKGLLAQDLPWGLVIVGMCLSAMAELLGVRSLPFAVGTYLPLSTSAPIFVGSLIKHWTDKSKGSSEESEAGSGALFSSGLIAGGAVTGIIIAMLVGINVGKDAAGNATNLIDVLHTGFADKLGAFGDVLSIMFFTVLGIILFKYAVSKK